MGWCSFIFLLRFFARVNIHARRPSRLSTTCILMCRFIIINWNINVGRGYPKVHTLFRNNDIRDIRSAVCIFYEGETFIKISFYGLCYSNKTPSVARAHACRAINEIVALTNLCSICCVSARISMISLNLEDRIDRENVDVSREIRYGLHEAETVAKVGY